MRRLKLFPKIFIYTFSILISLVAVAHLFLYFAFPHFYMQERQQELSRKADVLVQSLSQVDEKGAASALQVYANNEGITAYLKHESTGESLTLGAKLPIDENSKSRLRMGKNYLFKWCQRRKWSNKPRESLSIIYHCL